MAGFKVLLEFEGSKRELDVTSETVVVAIERELGELGRDITLAPLVIGNRESEGRDGKPTSTKVVYILQKWSKKWEAFVDITNVSEICDGDRLTVTPKPSPSTAASGVDTEEVTKRGASVCEKVGKPSGAHAKALRTMFPSSSSVSRKRSNSAFDPTDDCVFLQQQKRKKAARNKTTQVNIFVVEDHKKGVPRGASRKRLIEEQRSVKVELQRNMTPAQVKGAILQEVKHLNLTSSYTILQCDGHRLVEADNQQPDGEDMIESALKRKGAVVYICDGPTALSGIEGNGGLRGKRGCDDDLPVIDLTGPGLSTTPPMPTLRPSHMALSCPPVSHPSHPPVPPVGGPHVSHHSSLLEPPEGKEGSDYLSGYRQIRQEQDIAFAESLLVDQQKAKKAAEESRREEKYEHMRSVLKDKFTAPDPAGGVKVVFKLPDSVKLEYCFSPTDLTKVLYEFVFSSGRAGSSFSLFTLPRSVVPLSETCSLQECGITVPTIVIVEESDQSVAEALLPSVAIQVDKSLVAPGAYEAPTASHTLLDDNMEVVEIPPVRATLDLATDSRVEYVHNLNTRIGIAHSIDRSNLYDDVLKLFEKPEVLSHYPLRISFVGEMAVDAGGVCRDMLSGFWEEAYRKLFDGGTLLTPVVHAQSNMSTFATLGRILSHGYLVEGFLPVRVAFPTLAAMLLGQGVQVSEEVLVHSFAESLHSVEASLIKGSLAVTSKSFTIGVQSKLISLFSRFGSRQLPTPLNLRQQIVQVAQYEFLIKPMAALSMIHLGIPVNEQPFWKSKTVEDLHSLYTCLTATPSKVLEIMEEPQFVNPAQERVYGYLSQFIGNMKSDEIRNFLRFVTGSSVLSCAPIKVTFNNLSGLACRPISHTCDNCLELPTDYSTYVDFTSEFEAILSDTEYSWSMDAI